MNERARVVRGSRRGPLGAGKNDGADKYDRINRKSRVPARLSSAPVIYISRFTYGLVFSLFLYPMRYGLPR